MSLILDALDRARGERGESDPLAPAVPEAGTAPARKRLLVPFLVLALAAACALLAWLALERWTAPAPPPRAPAAAAPAAAADDSAAGPAAAARASPPATADTGAPIPAPDPAIAALYRAGSGRDEEGAAGAGSEPAEPQPSADAGSVDAPAAPVREETIDVEAVLARARRELGEPALAPHPAPLLAELPQQQKDAIPTLMYLRHDYTGDARSRVVLNGEARAAGDTIDGVRVEEILSDSVVLRYRDTLFRLRALNSWVNL